MQVAKLSLPPRQSRFAAVLILASGLSACGGGSTVPPGEPGYVKNAIGGVAADEPRAATIGRDILSGGGTAADAVVAMAFTAAVTLPSSSGLGAGGVCVAYTPKTQRADVIAFLPRGAGGPVTVPMLARGMALLHARHGRDRWESLLGPAEQLARGGTQVSRALNREMNDVPAFKRLDGEARFIYASARGLPLSEGVTMTQPELAVMLGRLRVAGAGDLHVGLGARQFADAARQSKIALRVEQLRDQVPTLLQPERVVFGDKTVLTADLSGVGAPGLGGARLAMALRGEGGVAVGGGAASGGAGFAAVDPDGNAVACSVTMNGRFGSGRMPIGSGLLLAAPPSEASLAALVPMLVISPAGGRAHAAIVASNGGAAATEAAAVIRAILPGGKGGMLAGALGGLTANDGTRVNGVHCPYGMPARDVGCEAKSDPRWVGLGLDAN